MRSTSHSPLNPFEGSTGKKRKKEGMMPSGGSLRLFAFSVLSFLVWLGVDRIGPFPVSSSSEGRKIARTPPTRPRFGEVHASERRIPLPSPILSFRRLLFFPRLR